MQTLTETTCNLESNALSEQASLSRTALTRWIAILAFWTLGACTWSFTPFFKKEISLPSSIDWLWNCVFIWTFFGLVWEFAQAFLLKDKYKNATCQAVSAWTATFKRFKGLTEQEHQAVLFIALRLFYLPLMVHFFITHISNFTLPENLGSPSTWLAQVQNFAWMQNTLYLIDTIPFVFAYLINSGSFRTRSVDSSFWGWFFCLSCYPPFNGAWGDVFPYFHEEFGGPWGWVALPLIVIYVWASVALGLKAGHLQFRGLCDKGPYAFIRHPAYASKTLAWVVGGIAVCWINIAHSTDWRETASFVSWNLASSIFWTWIYHRRAITEEKHLSKYPEYKEYCERVKYRYIPFVL